jgi:hypothetical protein
MKFLKYFLLSTLLSFDASAVTIRVEGFLEGDVTSADFEGDTMDYFQFEVLTTSPVRIEVVPGFGGALYFLAQFIGLEDEFALPPLGVPRRIDPPGREGRPQFIEGEFPAGIYVFVASAGGRSSYDIFDGFEPVNREGGGFQQFPYQYDITGDVRGLQYWDGHLDGTFTVTNFIPEPTASAFLLLPLFLLTKRKRTTNP